MLLKDKDLQVRNNLINLMSRAGEKGAVQLAAMLKDDDENVRMQAAATLRNMGNHLPKGEGNDGKQTLQHALLFLFLRIHYH